MVALPSILSIAGGFVCWMKKREKTSRQAELAATGWSHAFVAQEQQQQQQQQQQQAMETTATEVTAGRGSSSGHGSCHSRQMLTSSAGCHRLNEEADPTSLVMGSPVCKRTGVEIDSHPFDQVHQSVDDQLQSNYYFQRHRHHQLEQQRNTSLII